MKNLENLSQDSKYYNQIFQCHLAIRKQNFRSDFVKQLSFESNIKNNQASLKKFYFEFYNLKGISNMQFFN